MSTGVARSEVINRSTNPTLESGNLPSVSSSVGNGQLGFAAMSISHRETIIGQSGSLGTNHPGLGVSGGSKYVWSGGLGQLGSNLGYNQGQPSNSSGSPSYQGTHSFSSEMERGKREMELKLAQYRTPPLITSRLTSGTSWASGRSSGASTTAQSARTFGFGSQQQQSSFQSR